MIPPSAPRAEPGASFGCAIGGHDTAVSVAQRFDTAVRADLLKTGERTVSVEEDIPKVRKIKIEQAATGNRADKARLVKSFESSDESTEGQGDGKSTTERRRREEAGRVGRGTYSPQSHNRHVTTRSASPRRDTRNGRLSTRPIGPIRTRRFGPNALNLASKATIIHVTAHLRLAGGAGVMITPT